MSRYLTVGSYHVGLYCGERFWDFRNWMSHFKKSGLLRRMDKAFSIGPIICWKDKT